MLERLRYTQWNEQCIVRHLCEFCFTDMLRAIVNFVAVYTLKLALICVAIGKSVIFFLVNSSYRENARCLVYLARSQNNVPYGS